MKTIVLYGMRWSGKTTIGKALAKAIGYQFYDLDACIVEDIGMSVFDFVQVNGWDAFRQKEHESLVRVLDILGDTVISLGGGAIIFKNNQDILLKKADKMIYVECPVEMIRERMEVDEANGNKRNSLTGKNLLEELQGVYNERRACYESFYDYKVENTDSIDASIHSIVTSINR